MKKIAILIPCLNEALTVGKVVRDFRAALPDAEVHVFDNGSTDATQEEARRAGAVVHFVARRGKGNVVRTMFRHTDADIAVMVDGDDTYPADRVQELIAPILFQGADMVVGTRLVGHGAGSFRPLHLSGNKLVRWTSNLAFGARLGDMLSGYRAFSREFMKTMPVMSNGFEIETEISLHALAHGFEIVEVSIPYGARPEGSHSKLNTLHDGYRVLKTIFRMFKDHRPLLFFGTIGALAISLGVIAGVAVVREYLEYQRVVGAARAVLAVSAVLVGLLALTTGLVLDTVNRRSRELYILLAALTTRAPQEHPSRDRSRIDPTRRAEGTRMAGIADGKPRPKHLRR